MMNHIGIIDFFSFLTNLSLATVAGITLEITLFVLFVLVVYRMFVWCWHHTTVSDIVLILAMCIILYKNRS